MLTRDRLTYNSFDWEDFSMKDFSALLVLTPDRLTYNSFDWEALSMKDFSML